jgi:hypothetical protein
MFGYMLRGVEGSACTLLEYICKKLRDTHGADLQTEILKQNFPNAEHERYSVRN